MIDQGSRSTWGPGPSGSRLQIWKCSPPTPKTGAPYNFCFINVLPNQMVEAAEACQTLFSATWSQGLGYVVESQLQTFPILRSIPMPNFIEISLVVSISIGDTTHTLTFIY
jgi:hypothetical protein